MKAVILAAGKGLRLRPLTLTKQKCMLSIVDKPLLEHNVEILSEFCDEVIIVVGEKKKQIMNYFKNMCSYVEQKEQLGTAHAIKLVEKMVDNEFFVLNGDILVKKEDIERLISKKPITIAVYQVKEPWRCGVVRLKNKKIVDIVEKPAKGKEPSNLINAGAYLFDWRIFEAIDKTKISERGEYEITDSLKILIREGVEIKPFMLSNWIDIGTPRDLLYINKEGVKMGDKKDLLKEYNILYKAYIRLREELNVIRGTKESKINY